MSDIRDWDRDANQNQDTSPDGFPEGMAPGAVNNSSREVMAAVRRQQEVAQWFDWGHSISYVSGTSFTVPGDVTSIYQVGRRVWANMPVGGSIYGRVASAVFVTDTTVTVVWDSGDLLLESGITVSIGILTTVNTALPFDWLENQLGLQTPGILAFEDKEEFSKELVPIGTIRPWPATTVPPSPGTWLLCNGSAVSQTTYSDLYDLIGITFGNPGGGNFNLPDLRGRAAFGYDPGASTGRLTGYRQGIDADAIGNTGGEQAHTQTTQELARHGHFYDRTDTTPGAPGGLVPTPLPPERTISEDTGQSEPFNVTPPGLVLNWVIRAL